MFNPSFFYNQGADGRLVLDVDASNSTSYPGSGTTWFDISGSGFNGTLINAPVYTSTAPANFEFTSAGTKYVNFGNILNFTTQNFSFITWVKFNTLTTNSAGQGPIVFYKGTANINGYYLQVSNLGAILIVTSQSGALQFSRSNDGKITTGIWYCLGVSRNGSSVRLFINGVDNTDVANSHTNPAPSSDGFTLNRYAGGGGIYGNTNISVFRSFNKKLSSNEFLSYFNLTKSYFGY